MSRDTNQDFIAVDAGNTSITFGLFKADDCVASFHVPSSESGITEAQNLLRQWTPETLEGAVIGSVVPDLTGQIRSLLHTSFGVEPLVVTSETALPLENRYAGGQAGVDRLANAVGAVAIVGTPVIVIDVGTAATVDVISPDGAFAGGAILPGPALALESLATRTASLPRVPLVRPAHVVGRNTCEAMQSGSLIGLVGALNHLVTQAWRDLGTTGKVVGTGGFIELLVECGLAIDQMNPHITLTGLKKIWEHNAR